ncbi:sensor histidine kinase [Bacillus kwashiorkori]|uniref:sensor histidine kinase n=1 Tax=Bacillus kwashiorkori TaxID=1522318 RepID=UPI00078530B0|nr:HAMP domain-containing sensor histidine kinase [Bacillus kwashiorkori]
MKSLYSKFVIITLLMMFCSSMIAFVIANIHYQAILKPYNDEKNTDVALNVASFLQNNPDINMTAYFHNLAETGYQVYIVSEKDEVQTFGAPFRNHEIRDDIKEQVLNGKIYHGIANFPHSIFIVGFFANELKNSIGVPLQWNGEQYALFMRPNIKFLFNEFRIFLSWLLLLMIIFSVIMVIISTKFLVTPIAKLTDATKSLAKGNFAVEIDYTRKDEIGNLTRNFYDMAKKLGQLDSMRKEFISNISHDIQSPLANIEGYTSLLEKDTLTNEQKEQYIQIIKGETKRLSNLTKQLLLLASLDQQEDLLNKRHYSLTTQLKDLIRQYYWILEEKEIMLTFSLPPSHINGDRVLLEAVWDNLLNNAIKYNKIGGTIDIKIEQSEASMKVIFQDTGVGMTKEELEHIFDRFYRADTSRTRSVEGTGLGLAIVHSIVQMHGGTISVNSVKGEGTTFIIELPVDD